MNATSHFSVRLATACAAMLWLLGATALQAQSEIVAAEFAKSPVDSFRELLVMPADVRQKLLTKRSEQSRTRIAEKIREYSALAPEEREARLQATEISWYLTKLLSTPSTNRAAQLALIPQPKRALVESRLRFWQAMQPLLKRAGHTNQAINYLAGSAPASPAPTRVAEDARQKLKNSLDRLVKLRNDEKTKVLRVLPEAERQQMEKTLHAFEQLPADQRERCLQSFTKFATLSPADQQAFLKSAQLWSQMSAAERQSWRELVDQVALPSNPAPAVPVPTNG